MYVREDTAWELKETHIFGVDHYGSYVSCVRFGSIKTNTMSNIQHSRLMIIYNAKLYQAVCHIRI